MRLDDRVRAVFEAHWREPGYTCPSAERYPWQWLWDSCFHSLVWHRLGDDRRAVAELANVFAGQEVATGFVPHVAYWGEPSHHADFWGREGFSCITQPPMYGHTVAQLLIAGVDVPDQLLGAARSGLGFLLERRRRSAAGLIEVAHPWETGADDSPRWDDLTSSPFVLARWKERKGELVSSITFDDTGSPVANDECPVASVGLNALIAFNAFELGAATGDAGLVAQAEELSSRLTLRWDEARLTWVDDGPTESGSGRARTLDSMLAALVDPDSSHVRQALDQLADPDAYGARFGPTGVHRGEPTFAPDVYWRGPAWPQLSYLLWVAATRAGRIDTAQRVGAALMAAADVSDLAEYWNPDTGAGGGAAPQSWTGLALLVEN